MQTIVRRVIKMPVISPGKNPATIARAGKDEQSEARDGAVSFNLGAVVGKRNNELVGDGSWLVIEETKEVIWVAEVSDEVVDVADVVDCEVVVDAVAPSL